MADEVLGAELLLAVFDRAPDPHILTRSDGTVLAANAAARAIFGDQMVGRPMGELTPPNDLAPHTTAVSTDVNLNVFRALGDKRAHQKVQEAENTVARTEARFRALIEKGSDVIWVVDAAGKTTYVSPSIFQVVGYTVEELIGGPPGEVLVHPDDREKLLSVRAELRGPNTKSIESGEIRVLHKDGSVRWIAIEGTNRLDDPNVLGVISNLRDVTERRRAEDALRASELRYRRIIESTSDGVWTVDPSGITTFGNRRMAELLGCSVDELIGQPITRFIDPAEAQQCLDRRRQGISEVSELKLRSVDGSELQVEIRASPLSAEDGRYMGGLAVVTNMTARRRAAADQAHLAAIVAHSDDAILSMDSDGTLTSWNLGAQNLFGWSAAEAIGRDIGLLSPPGARRDPSVLLDRCETEWVHRDGSRVELSLTISPVRDPQGVVVGASLIARDLRERRRVEAELRVAEEQLRQAQKMEAIGTLAGGVAHDFNNLLSIILGYCDLVLGSLDPSEPIAADIGEIRRAGARASDLTKQLLAFSRQQPLKPRVIHLNQVLTDMEGMLRRLLREDVVLSLLTAPILGTVHVDPTQMIQIVMNLVVNAVDSMPAGGRLTIETDEVDIDAAYASTHLGVVAGRYVVLAISDSGEGMDAETRGRIFEPFFTTKEKGKGTGLGLSTVYGIVKQSGGAVWVYSEPGVGSVFKVYLPCSNRPPDDIEAPLPLATLRGSETILLVEDEDEVRVLARTVLRRAGYNVLDAQNGGEAFLLCEQYPARIDLLLTDVVMPRMSGRQLAERVAPLRPDMRVLFMSGYTDSAIVHHGIVDSGVAFVEKPLTPDLLLREVRKRLESPNLLSAK